MLLGLVGLVLELLFVLFKLLLLWLLLLLVEGSLLGAPGAVPEWQGIIFRTHIFF